MASDEEMKALETVSSEELPALEMAVIQKSSDLMNTTEALMPWMNFKSDTDPSQFEELLQHTPYDPEKARQYFQHAQTTIYLIAQQQGACSKTVQAAEEAVVARQEGLIAIEGVRAAEERFCAAEERFCAAKEKIPAAEEEVRAAEDEVRAAEEEVRAAKEKSRAAMEKILATEEKVLTARKKTLAIGLKMVKEMERFKGQLE